MTDCEICGSGVPHTRRVSYVGSNVDACPKCIDLLGLSQQRPPNRRRVAAMKKSSGGYRGGGKAGKDIMIRGQKELRADFAKMIIAARESRGWTKKMMASEMDLRLNILQKIESGVRPEDEIIKRIEKILGIQLMVERDSKEVRFTTKNSGSGMTLGDFFEH